MAADMGNVGVRATLGKVSPRIGKSPPDPPADKSFTATGAAPMGGGSGHTDMANPWEGSNATPKPGELPPLRSL